VTAMRRRSLVSLLAATLAASGCATFELGDGMQKIWIESRPEGATALILPDELMVETPVQIRLERRLAHTIRIEKPGYCRETVYLDRVATASRDLPLPLGLGIGIWVDTRTGAAWTLRPDHLSVPPPEPL
jgi:hypothetical protein